MKYVLLLAILLLSNSLFSQDRELYQFLNSGTKFSKIKKEIEEKSRVGNSRYGQLYFKTYGIDNLLYRYNIRAIQIDKNTEIVFLPDHSFRNNLVIVGHNNKLIYAHRYIIKADSIDTIVDSPKWKEQKKKYKNQTGLELDVKNKRLFPSEEIEYTPRGCGDVGTKPTELKDFDKAITDKNAALFEKWIWSFIPKIQFYGIVGLRALEKKGQAISTKSQERINLIWQENPKILICQACDVSYKHIQDIVSFPESSSF